MYNKLLLLTMSNKRRNGMRILCIVTLALLVSVGIALADPCPTVDKFDNTPGCNIIATVNPDGSVTVVPGVRGSAPYDGSEDQVIGVVNNLGAPLFSLTLSGSQIFLFDGDGICAGYTSACTLDAGHPTTYEGNNGVSSVDGTGGAAGQSFTIVDTDNGTINFIGGLANGANAFFSLEEPPNIAGLTIVVGGVPEPSSIMLLGSSLLGASFALRKRLA